MNKKTRILSLLLALALSFGLFVNLIEKVFANNTENDQNTEQTGQMEEDYFDYMINSIARTLDGEWIDISEREDFSQYDSSLELQDIFSNDYPEIKKPFLNREWLNRIIVEIVKEKSWFFHRPDSRMWIVGFGLDSNMAYFYPGNSEVVYLYSGLYNNRNIVEIQTKYQNTFNRRKRDKSEKKDDKKSFRDKYFADFAFYAKMLEFDLTEEEIENGFAEFYKHNNNFQMGKLTVYQEGLQEGVIYFSRDITEEIKEGIYPDYSQSLKNQTNEPIINNTTRALGYPESPWPVSKVSREKIEKLLNPLIFSSSYDFYLKKFTGNYSAIFTSPDFSKFWSIENITELEYDYIFQASRKLSLKLEDKQTILVKIPKSYINNNLIVGDNLARHIKSENHLNPYVNFMGYSENGSGDLLPSYYVIPKLVNVNSENTGGQE